MIKLPSHVISSFQLVYRRLRRLGLAVLLIVLIEQSWSAMHNTSLINFQKHSQQLVELTAKQAAFEARSWLLINDHDHLQLLVEHLQEQPFIAAAQIQGRYGQTIVTSTGLPEADALQQELVLIEEIQEDGKVVGYLKVSIDETLLLQKPVQTLGYLSFYGQFLLAFAILAGVFITITFNRWRYRRPTSLTD
jgi:uncharacterized membrane protein affecting hemolysin expression